jgi:hypothetical protein
MIQRKEERFGLKPERLVGDTDPPAKSQENHIIGGRFHSLGQKATSDRYGMSGLPPGADMPVKGSFAPQAAV